MQEVRGERGEGRDQRGEIRSRRSEIRGQRAWGERGEGREIRSRRSECIGQSEKTSCAKRPDGFWKKKSRPGMNPWVAFRVKGVKIFWVEAENSSLRVQES